MAYSTAALLAAAVLYISGVLWIGRLANVAPHDRGKNLYPGFRLATDQTGVVLQRTYADCGLAALEMLSSLRARKADTSTVQNGATPFGVDETIMRAALQKTFRRHFDVHDTTLSHLRRDAPVLFLHDGHYSVLQRSSGNAVEILDPWFGRIVGSTTTNDWRVLALVERPDTTKVKRTHYARND